MIAVVVTTFNAPPGTLDACLRSVIAGGAADLVIVVDNGGHGRLPVELDGRDDVRLVRQQENRGFGAAANAGFAVADAAGATAIALLNDDVEVESGWLATLSAELGSTAGDGHLGAVQPKLLYAGTSPAVVNSLGVRLDRFGAGHDIGHGEVDGAWAGDVRSVEMFTGGAVLFEREFLRATGGFDERFFMYYEDVDLAGRGRELGWSYRCQPSAVVWHRGGASASALGPRRVYYQERNRLWCLWRFANGRTRCAGLWLSIRRLIHRPRRAHLHGLFSGIAGIPARINRRERGTQHTQ